MIRRIIQLDNIVLDKIKILHSPLLNKIMATITRLGNFGLVWFALCLPLIISKKYRSAGCNIVFALIVTFIVGEIMIKRIVARVRPSNQLDDDELVISRPKEYSFPSGHTASSFCVVAVSVLRCPPLFFFPILFLACLIGFSRVYLRVHYLSDVAVGAVLGFMLGCASVALFDHFIPYQF